jgi:cytochrome c oxidase cbb3-type subunit III
MNRVTTLLALTTLPFIAASCDRTPSPAVERAASAAERVLNASPYSIAADAELEQFVNATAEVAITTHCARCHGDDLRGQPGVPNLLDYDWLWGITGDESSDVGPVMEIEQTILYGVRNKECPDIASLSIYGGCIDTRYSEMPAYGNAGVFNDAQIGDLAEYVLSLSGQDADQAAVDRAQPMWAVCAECHGQNGQGYRPYGGPDLTDDIWLYGGERASIADVISKGRLGVCPPWGKTLDAATIKALAVYIYRKSFEG